MLFNKSKKTSNVSTNDHIFNISSLNNIFSLLDYGLVYLDKNLKIISFNPYISTLSGWEAEDALNINIDLVIRLANTNNQMLTDEQNPLHQVFISKQPGSFDNLYLINKHNQPILITIKVDPINDEQGIVGAIIIVKDLKSIQNQDNRIKDFINTASHEMRTPLATIEGYIDLALNPKTATIDSRAKNYLDKSKDSMRDLAMLFQNLLTSSEAEDKRVNYIPKVVELSELLAKHAQNLSIISNKKNVPLEFTIGSRSPEEKIIPTKGKQLSPGYYAYIDPIKFSEVIDNLLDNAIKYTTSGKITVGIGADEESIQMYVQDTGAGIPAEDLPHLFQKFYRVDNTLSRNIGGNGLGLYLCQKIIELFNGRIWVTSVVGKGSTFYVSIPRLNNDQVEKLNQSLVVR